MRRAMTMLVLCASLGLLGGGLLCQPSKRSQARGQADPPAQDPKANKVAELKALAKVRFEVAKETYEMASRDLGQVKRAEGKFNILVVKPEEVYTSSVRLLSAERDLSSKKEDRIAALEDHLKRMKMFEEKVKSMNDASLVSRIDLFSAKYARVEAEYWLVEEKAK